jgi:hypothetical protein
VSAGSGGGDVAVLTGDLVGSRALSPDRLAEARTALEAAALDAAAWEPGLALGALEFFRGDSWQFALARPRRFLRVALFLRARLKALGRDLDTRIGVGLGPVERLDPERVSRSTGEAFIRSGAALDGMKRRERLALYPDGAGAELRAIAMLCAAVADRWSPAQALALAAVLAPAAGGVSHAAVATQTGTARVTATHALLSGRWDVLAGVLETVEVAA